MRDSELNELTGLLYEAAWDPASAPSLLKRMKKAFRACNATLGIASPGFDVISRYHSLTPPDLAVNYADVIEEDLWTKALTEQPRSGAFLGTDLVDQNVYRKTEIYQRFNKPCDIEYLGIAADAKNTQVRSWLTVNRSRRQGDFSSDDRRALKQLYRHLARAASLHWSSARPAEWRFRVGRQGLEEVDGDFDDLHCRLPSLRVEATGIRSTDLVLDKQLQESLARARRTGSAAELKMPLEDGQGCLVVRVASPHPTAHSIPVQTAIALEPASSDRSQAISVAKAYRLTRCASEIVVAVCRGQSVADIALERSTSVGAVRFHLKNVFQKLNVRRQSELVTFVLNGPVGCHLLGTTRIP